MVRLAAVALIALVVLGGPRAGVSSTSRGTTAPPAPRTIRTYGVHTFRSLGYADDVFEPFPGDFTYDTINFLLPKPLGHEGGKNWYILHLHYRAELDPSMDRPISFGAGLNGYGSVLVELSLSHFGGDPVAHAVSWSNLTGRNAYTASGTVVEGRYRDFFPTMSIRPGLNVLQLIVAEGHDSLVRRVDVFSDSSIERTSKGLARLRLRVAPRRQVVHLGHTFKLTATVEGAGQRTSHDIGVSLNTDMNAFVGVEPTGSWSWKTAALTPGKAASHTFHGHATKKGYFRVDISAANRGTRRSTAVTVVVKK